MCIGREEVVGAPQCSIREITPQLYPLRKPVDASLLATIQQDLKQKPENSLGSTVKVSVSFPSSDRSTNIPIVLEKEFLLEQDKQVDSVLAERYQQNMHDLDSLLADLKHNHKDTHKAGWTHQYHHQEEPENVQMTDNEPVNKHKSNTSLHRTVSDTKLNIQLSKHSHFRRQTVDGIPQLDTNSGRTQTMCEPVIQSEHENPVKVEENPVTSATESLESSTFLVKEQPEEPTQTEAPFPQDTSYQSFNSTPTQNSPTEIPESQTAQPPALSKYILSQFLFFDIVRDAEFSNDTEDDTGFEQVSDFSEEDLVPLTEQFPDNVRKHNAVTQEGDMPKIPPPPEPPTFLTHNLLPLLIAPQPHKELDNQTLPAETQQKANLEIPQPSLPLSANNLRSKLSTFSNPNMQRIARILKTNFDT